jgi:mono/diheme cytochrome c family protein
VPRAAAVLLLAIVVVGAAAAAIALLAPRSLGPYILPDVPRVENPPPDMGTPAAGELLYHQSCVNCHGVRLEGGVAARLAGPGAIDRYPSAVVLFDYIRRTMPPPDVATVTDAEVYSVVAYLLDQNGLLPAGSRLDPDTIRRLTIARR